MHNNCLTSFEECMINVANAAQAKVLDRLPCFFLLFENVWIRLQAYFQDSKLVLAHTLAVCRDKENFYAFLFYAID